jgi:PilZ domain
MGPLNLSLDRNSRQIKAFQMAHTSQKQAMVSERRTRQRFSINAPLTLFIGDREIPAYTRDLSNRGVYFYLALADLPFVDCDFEFLVELPPEITLSTCCRIRCRGRAVREEKTSNNLTGIAAEILDYSILRDPFAIV